MNKIPQHVVDGVRKKQKERKRQKLANLRKSLEPIGYIPSLDSSIFQHKDLRMQHRINWCDQDWRDACIMMQMAEMKITPKAKLVAMEFVKRGWAKHSGFITT